MESSIQKTQPHTIKQKSPKQQSQKLKKIILNLRINKTNKTPNQTQQPHQIYLLTRNQTGIKTKNKTHKKTKAITQPTKPRTPS